MMISRTMISYDGTRLHELRSENGDWKGFAELTDEDRRDLNRELEEHGSTDRWYLYDTEIYY